MIATGFRTFITGAFAPVLFVLLSFNPLSAALIVSDGFGDGDRDNNGLDSGAVVTNASDVGIPWLLTDGTSAINFKVVDDSAGLGNDNALQLNNTGSNNRPTLGHFSPVTMVDGDRLILRFDARNLSTLNATGGAITADRVMRWGLYHDTAGDDGTVDHGSASSVSVDDVGYNVRVDGGADASNSTSMDVTRDDSATGTNILQATTTGLGIASSNNADQFNDTSKHHFELTIQRFGSSMIVTLQNNSTTISGTDASPPGFVYDEVALGVRSNAAMDLRIDNLQVEYQPVPEPATFGIALVSAGALLLTSGRRRSK